MKYDWCNIQKLEDLKIEMGLIVPKASILKEFNTVHRKYSSLGDWKCTENGRKYTKAGIYPRGWILYPFIKRSIIISEIQRAQWLRMRLHRYEDNRKDVADPEWKSGINSSSKEWLKDFKRINNLVI